MERNTNPHRLPLDPNVQIYLARIAEKNGCWSEYFPIPFERAAERSWFDPMFDSHVLEQQFRHNTIDYWCRKFRYALYYFLLVFSLWLLLEPMQWLLWLILSYNVVTLGITFTYWYQRNMLALTTSFVCVILSLTIWLQLVSVEAIFYPLSIQLVLIIYTLLPLKLYVVLCTTIAYSTLLEILILILSNQTTNVGIFYRFSMHFCTHLIGLHIAIMANVRLRNTFLKVGQTLLVRKQLEAEKQLKENMLHSLMPPSVAHWLLQQSKQLDSTNGSHQIDLQSLFRPFNMNRMENVSILFADIVGFTQLSSRRSAEELVEILNDLFQRFDELCARNNCEKIATLGDCYYCVCGCPEPCSNHAICTVDMGLAMIDEVHRLNTFENDNRLNIRVGIHTGTVLCGIVGMRRFKFDVWSNDVTLANKLEATGKPGMVHISEKTLSHLGDAYKVQENTHISGMKTYFILSKKRFVPSLHSPVGSLRSEPQKLTKKRFRTNSLPIDFNTEPQPQINSASRKLLKYPKIIKNLIFGPKPAQSCCSDEKSTTNSQIDDVKSYISQSRNDLGQKYDFNSSNFCRFFCQRNMEPKPRGRSATLAAPLILMQNLSPPQPVIAEESSPRSFYSRKDSGIKSTSRRSSILETIEPSDLNQQQQHRVSGYYTSSSESLQSSRRPSSVKTPMDLNKLRKQSDRQLIKCLQDSLQTKSDFLKPPLNRYTLFFNRTTTLEMEYRRNAHNFHRKQHDNQFRTLATSRFSTYYDFFATTIILLVTAISLMKNSWFLMILALFFTLHFIIMLLLQCGLKTFYQWNFFGVILQSLPIILLIIVPEVVPLNYYVALVNFCTFTQLNCWWKNCIVTALGIVLVLNQQLYKLYEVLDFLMVLGLVWVLNREFEIGYRISFHANQVATLEKQHVEMLKDQADYLIYNIVPEHVADQLRKNAKYTENFRNVGVIFASIVNFNEMYDESFEGGKEYLRVLNELIGDFDELLDRPEFQTVEKIKTIGSTFMAASGLDTKRRLKQSDPDEHLYALMNFALELQTVISNFNRDLLEFNFILRVGYNFGEVTAAVIGNTKLHYDIWGDAVNIASRMDTTGVNGHIQVGEHCLPVLERKYVFQPRGTIYVKGKDHMNVFLVQHKRK